MRFEDTLCFCFVFMCDSLLHFVTVPGCCWCRRMPKFWSRIKANLTMEHRASAAITSGRTSYSIQASDLHQPESQVVSFGDHFVFLCFSTSFLRGILRITCSSKAFGAAGSGQTGKKLEYVGLLDLFKSFPLYPLIFLSFLHTPFLLLRPTTRLCRVIQNPESFHMTPKEQVDFRNRAWLFHAFSVLVHVSN